MDVGQPVKPPQKRDVVIWAEMKIPANPMKMSHRVCFLGAFERLNTFKSKQLGHVVSIYIYMYV